MRTLPLLAIGLVAAGLGIAPVAPAGAAGETCQGQAATIVGTYLQQRLVGTEGPDVVVTNGAMGLDTLGGNDLVCVTDGERPVGVTLRTGAGDDVVDASQSQASVDAELGTGADRYTASAGRDSVVTGSTDGGTRTDTDADTVVASTGARSGQSGDQVSSGMAGAPNADVVQLAGVGHTLYWSGFQAPGSQVALGTDATLQPVVGSGAIAVDAAGSWSEDGVPVVTWTGEVARFTLIGEAPRSLSFIGTDRSEYVYSSFYDGFRSPQHVDLGGGDDTLVSPDGIGGWGSAYVGGPGEDSIDLWAGNRLGLDLAKGRLVNRVSGTTSRSTLRGWDDVRVGARRLALRGTMEADDLRFYACTATVRGRGGKDSLASYRTGDDYDHLDCDARKSRIRIYGDGGNDVLAGSRGKDLLVGGPGRDTIDGNANRDRCSGERLEHCEVRLR